MSCSGLERNLCLPYHDVRRSKLRCVTSSVVWKQIVYFQLLTALRDLVRLTACKKSETSKSRILRTRCILPHNSPRARRERDVLIISIAVVVVCAYTSITSRYTYYSCTSRDDDGACKTHATKNAYNDGRLLRKQKSYYFFVRFPKRRCTRPWDTLRPWRLTTKMLRQSKKSGRKSYSSYRHRRRWTRENASVVRDFTSWRSEPCDSS